MGDRLGDKNRSVVLIGLLENFLQWMRLNLNDSLEDSNSHKNLMVTIPAKQHLDGYQGHRQPHVELPLLERKTPSVGMWEGPDQ